MFGFGFGKKQQSIEDEYLDLYGESIWGDHSQEEKDEMRERCNELRPQVKEERAASGEKYYCSLCECMMPISHFPH